MSHENPKIHKYAARIPNPEYGRAAEKCKRLGISMNTGLIQALRHWCDSVADNAPIPVHQKLSDVIRLDLEAMEARLMAVLDPQGHRNVLSMDVSAADMNAIAGALGVPYEQLVEDLSTEIGTKLVSTREGASFTPPAFLVTPHVPDEPQSLPEALRQAKAKEHLIIPGSLEWDKPVPAEQRSFPELPAVNALSPRPLEGQDWVIVGSLKAMTKDRARDLLQHAGANVAGSVNKRTAALILGDGYTGEKLTAAEVHGTPIWTETQFLNMARFVSTAEDIPQ